jgi:hypothetical protein
MRELSNPIIKGMEIKRKSRAKIEDTKSENRLSLVYLLPKSILTNLAEIKTEINAPINAIIKENSKPRVPINGKKVSKIENKAIKAIVIRTFFESNISINVMRPST